MTTAEVATAPAARKAAEDRSIRPFTYRASDPAPRSWAERAYPRLIHYNRLDKGGHFAAFAQPQLFVDELRAGFRSLRPVGGKSGAKTSNLKEKT
jgi:hypothetical protein